MLEEVAEHHITDFVLRRNCVGLERHDGDANGPVAHLACLDDAVYLCLLGVADDARRTAAACGEDRHSALRALLMATDVDSRAGYPEQALHAQLRLLDEAREWPALHRRIMMMLSTTNDRLGRRTEAANWIDQAMNGWEADVEPRWRAEAMMVFTLGTLSHHRPDFSLAHETVRAVRESASVLLQSVTLANFAELAAEVNVTDEATFFADAAGEILFRHPETVSPLTLDSIACARIAGGELATAELDLRLALQLEPTFGYTDIHGEPRLTLARLLVARSQPAEALHLLNEFVTSGRGTPWLHCRATKLRGEAHAGLGQWRDAYECLELHLQMYERQRSIEGDREVIASESRQLASEHRNRAEALARLAFTDSLTGLPNRRSMQQWLDDLSDAEETIAVAIVDLDRFKAINDRFGHDIGDDVLRVVSQVLAEHAQGNVRAARLGGEEFVAVFTAANEHEVRRWAETFRQSLAAVRMDDIAADLRVTASIGIAIGTAADSRALLKTADQNLYRAKSSGRNTVAA